MLLDFAPRAEERPTYVGLGNTALAPVLCTTPLVAGLVADTLGLRAVFAIALGGALLATVSCSGFASRAPRRGASAALTRRGRLTLDPVSDRRVRENARARRNKRPMSTGDGHG